jgi:TetR/AcrR family transcriptional regulator, transcriptional repressor for nem operon
MNNNIVHKNAGEMKKSEKTEKKILEAALELFFKKGYAATSISEITSSVGMTKGALYSHFKSKDELLHRLFQEYKTNFLDELIRSVNEYEGNAVDKLHHAITFYARFGQDNLHMVSYLNFVSHELKTNEDFEFILKNLYQEQRKLISGLIETGIRQGLLKKDLDPNLTALTFMGLNDGILHHWVLNRNLLDGRQYVRTMRKIFFEGVLGPLENK